MLLLFILAIRESSYGKAVYTTLIPVQTSAAQHGCYVLYPKLSIEFYLKITILVFCEKLKHKFKFHLKDPFETKMVYIWVFVFFTNKWMTKEDLFGTPFMYYNYEHN